MKSSDKVLVDEANEIAQAITDDIEVIGPGRLLSDARKAMGLTQEQVAEKLNFRKTLVLEIEAEKFDASVPSTFHRGYLRNYAKLVNVSADDVVASFELLDDNKRQGAKLQSFSKGTEKQAEHNLVMWITYIIIAAFIIATVVWWYQTSPVQSEVSLVERLQSSLSGKVETRPEVEVNEAVAQTSSEIPTALVPAEDVSFESTTVTQQDTEDTELTSQAVDAVNEEAANEPELTQVNAAPEPMTLNSAVVEQEASSELTRLVFTFSGDCWVNIYDATGERIAWGVKKQDYVMEISGVAPFKVTLGRPELVAIDINGGAVDMSTFDAGNIAKFSLPLEP